MIAGSLIILAILFDGLRRKKKKFAKPLVTQESHQKEANQRVFHEEILGIRTQQDDSIQTEIIDTITVQDITSLDDDSIPDPIAVTQSISIVEETTLPPLFSLSDDDFRQESFPQTGKVEEEPLSVKEPQFISIRVVPGKGEKFGGYELLRAVLACGMHYGEKKLFHRYLNSLTKQKKLFSLASLNEPGDFDINQMKSYQCDGLIFYMDASEHGEPIIVFEEMLQTAQQLSHALDGSLMASQQQPWTVKTTEKIRSELIKR